MMDERNDYGMDETTTAVDEAISLAVFTLANRAIKDTSARDALAYAQAAETIANAGLLLAAIRKEERQHELDG